MKIGIIGLGVVGSAIKNVFEEKHQMYVHDILLDTDLTDVTHNCDLAYICVPTPTSEETGGCDISAIRSILSRLDPDFSAIIKSTVIPGTTKLLQEEFRHLKLAFCPEFLRSSSATRDFRNQEILVVGTEHEELAEIIHLHHLQAGVDVEDGFFRITSTQAELVKYAINSFYAMKVIFGNQFQRLADRMGEDWGPVKEILTYPRSRGISDSHLNATGEYGFGGSCLPKDTLAITKFLEGEGIATNLIRSLLLDNENYRK